MLRKGRGPFLHYQVRGQSHRYQAFNKWVGHVLAQAGMKVLNNNDEPGNNDDLGEESGRFAVPVEVEYGDPDLCGVMAECDQWLEDVAMLTMPMFGKAHIASLYLDGEDKNRINALNTSLLKSKYLTNKTTYLLFRPGGRDEQSIRFDAFLAYWLSYFVFPRLFEDGLHIFVFPMAVLLAQGKRLALALLSLGAIYALLDEYSKNVGQSGGMKW